MNPPSAGSRRILAGSLDDVDLFSIAQFLILQRKTGVLTLCMGDVTAIVWFENGQIVNGRLPGAADGLEAIRRIFRQSQGTFEFLPSTIKCPVLVTAESQSLLMDLAIEADESSRIMAAVPPPSPVPELADDGPQVRPVVARVVRPSAPPPPHSAARFGDQPTDQAPAQPQFSRHPFSQEEFVRNIEHRREVEDTELPSRRLDAFRRPSRAAGAPRNLTPLLAAIGIPTILVLAGLIAWLASATSPAKPVQASIPKPAPTPVKDYKFVTAPESPARLVEKAFTDLSLHCPLQSVEYDPKDARQVNIRLVREVFWDRNELASDIALDSVALVQRVFDTQPNIGKILIVVKSRLSRELGQGNLEDAFIMTASRPVYMDLKPSYGGTHPLVVIERFGGRFSSKLVQP